MRKRIFQNFAPRSIIFAMDLTLVSIAFFSTFFLIYHLSVNVPDLARFLPSFIINIIVCNICIAVFSIHEGIIRFSETKDIVRVAKFAFLQFAIWLVLFSLDKNRILFAPISIPFLIFNMFAVIFLLGGMRLLVKEIYQVAQFRPSSESKSLIFGAGMMGQVTKKVLDQDPKIGSTLVGFIDDSYYKVGKKIDNLPIYSAVGSDLIDLIKDKKVSNIYIAIDRLTVERKLALTDLCAPLKTKIHVVPHAKDWNRGLFQKNQLREMNIEELLHRDEIEMPTEINAMQYSGATILVTGAAGSIGSEICRQLIKHNVKLLILLDQSESGLFDLEYELKQHNKNVDLKLEVASARETNRIKKVFDEYHPSIVFHVAAYKHVPLMEYFPNEAVLTNVLGTKVVADISMQYGINKFVLVSTDKAVNPTNIMGATKRISEIYIQSLNDNKDCHTQFITTRFGNVLGSAGSVVATFKKQIAAGGPVTITHPEITRYFMTIPEAAKLVLEAGKIGTGGDILLFDMGEPVKVIDLARRMIQLAGFIPEKEIKIVATQLRPGEKMFEELFKDSEAFAETDHPKILKARKASLASDNYYNLLHELIETAKEHNPSGIATIIKKMLPEFNHNNGTAE